MYKFKTGDLVAKKHPSNNIVLKTGIIISDSDTNIVIKWFSYNKDFFMEKSHDIFHELNKYYLLSYRIILIYNKKIHVMIMNQ